MSDIKRKKGESFDSFLRRVRRRWKQSGRILEARKRTVFTPKKSKNVQRNSAVVRSQKISKTNYLRKIGRLPQEEDRFGNRKGRR